MNTTNIAMVTGHRVIKSIVPSFDGWHLPLLQSNILLLEDVPPGRLCTVVLHQSGGEEQFRGSIITTQLRNVSVWGDCTQLQLLKIIFKIWLWKWNAFTTNLCRHHFSSKELWGDNHNSIQGKGDCVAWGWWCISMTAGMQCVTDMNMMKVLTRL